MIEDPNPDRGDLTCPECGHSLSLTEVFVYNHRDPPHALISLSPLTGARAEMLRLKLNAILDEGADEKGIVGAGIDKHGVEGPMYGDYNASIEPGTEQHSGVIFELLCTHCEQHYGDVIPPSAYFEIRVDEHGKTKFIRTSVDIAPTPVPLQHTEIRQ